MKQVGILIELKQDRVTENTLGMITLAARQADTAVIALFPGGVTEEHIATVSAHGVTTVADLALPRDPSLFRHPGLRADAVSGAVAALKLDALFGLSGAEGKDILPRVAARLDAPLVMDCIQVDLATGIARTSQYSGKVLADIQVTGPVQLFGIRGGAVTPEPCPKIAQVVVLTSPQTAPAGMTLVAWEDAVAESSRPGLTDAPIIVAGGRGMKHADNFGLLFACADKLKAAVGASRVAVDEGWIPYAHQVGQTGEKVSPAVYIACGISGSIQHFAGMKTARMIIAINTDKNAAMVANSDYYVIADLFDILPELIRQL